MAKGFTDYVFNNLKSSGFYHNYDYRHYPTETLPYDNHVNRHIEIYLLVKEYVDLYEDGKNASEATAKLIKERLNEIAKKLAKTYYIVTEDELK
jgi:hypothetical protein